MPSVSLDDLQILQNSKGFFIGTSNLLLTQ